MPTCRRVPVVYFAPLTYFLYFYQHDSAQNAMRCRLPYYSFTALCLHTRLRATRGMALYKARPHFVSYVRPRAFNAATRAPLTRRAFSKCVLFLRLLFVCQRQFFSGFAVLFCSLNQHRLLAQTIAPLAGHKRPERANHNGTQALLFLPPAP